MRQRLAKERSGKMKPSSPAQSAGLAFGGENAIITEQR
jgi:hypothetical protein